MMAPLRRGLRVMLHVKADGQPILRKGYGMSDKDKLEVWKNTTAGLRWCEVTDRQGRQTTRLVKGGRTFTITPFERQLNQDAAAEPELDHFRNGTFILIKKAVDTDMAEIESPDSLTDAEILGTVHELMAKNMTVSQALKGIKSPVALQRIYERAVAEDISKSQIDEIKDRLQMAEGTAPVQEHEVASPPPKPEPKVKTPRGGVPEMDTEKVVKTEPVKG